MRRKEDSPKCLSHNKFGNLSSHCGHIRTFIFYRVFGRLEAVSRTFSDNSANERRVEVLFVPRFGCWCADSYVGRPVVRASMGVAGMSIEEASLVCSEYFPAGVHQSTFSTVPTISVSTLSM